jgi:hypothetical protein
MDSPFEFLVKPVADMPLVQCDSSWSGQGSSAENPIGNEEAEFPRFRAVVVAAEPLEDILLGDGTVSYVVMLQRAGAILVCQTAHGLRPSWFFCGRKFRWVTHCATSLRPLAGHRLFPELYPQLEHVRSARPLSRRWYRRQAMIEASQQVPENPWLEEGYFLSFGILDICP